jgi:hypothetical protein
MNLIWGNMLMNVSRVMFGRVVTQFFLGQVDNRIRRVVELHHQRARKTSSP